MLNELMEAEDSSSAGKGDAENVMEVSETLGPVSKKSTEILPFPKSEKENEKSNPNEPTNTSQNEALSLSLPLSPAVTNTAVFHTQSSASVEKAKSLWTVKSPMLVKPCPNTFAIRRKSHENYSPKHFEDQPLPQNNTVNKSNHSVGTGLGLADGSPSAFMRKGGRVPPAFMDIDLDGNLLKRCNSAPILNDAE